MKHLKAIIVAIALTVTISPTVSAFDILLTNDDGYQALGINTVYDALTAAGHNVTMLAPMTNQSGTGMRFNTAIFEPVAFVQFAPGKYYLDGSPADTVAAALTAVMVNNPPDLVISGANMGANVGPISWGSGTVGAALKALQKQVPAIAFSVARNGDAAQDNAAEFLVQLIDQITDSNIRPLPWWCVYAPGIEQCVINPGAILLPAGVGLNVNYPALEANEVTGVVITSMSEYSSADFNWSAFGDLDSGVLTPAINLNTPPPTLEQETEDVVRLENGYITITPIAPDMNANMYDAYNIETVLNGLLTDSDLYLQ